MTRYAVRGAALAAVGCMVTITVAGLSVTAGGGTERVREIRSSTRLSDGRRLETVNHLVLATAGSGGAPSKYLVVWAGDWNASDISSKESALDAAPSDQLPAPDFLAVIDADPSSHSYGAVVNTVTIAGPDGFENEPHHMQYTWRRGDRIYAGGLFGDRTFVFDVDALPVVRLAGVVEPMDTPCGSVPDAYWVLRDGTAFGTYMGGPNVAGDPRCNAGINNGFAGTPGEIVRIARDGRVLGEHSAAGDVVRPWANDIGRPQRCVSNPPLVRASCANPHGIQAREDLGLMVTADYAEPRNVPIDPATQVDPNVFRDTVRVWDIADLDHPRLRSVSVMPRGSMAFLPPEPTDAKGVMGIMETTVTNMPGHKGAFSSSMCGGQIYYSADISVANPMWREVFDLRTAAASILGPGAEPGGCAGAGWIQTSPDDTTLFQAVIGRNPGTLGPDDPGIPKMVYALDIRPLLAVPPSGWVVEAPGICAIDTEPEVFAGGSESNCPSFLGAVQIRDTSSGGPHWGAIDTFSLSDEPGRQTSVRRIAVSDYFVARAGINGDHRVCVIDVAADGTMSIDTSFRDEVRDVPCVDFNRALWPHGPFRRAKPHSMLFVAGPGGPHG